MILKLNNPTTPEYLKLKKFIFSDQFPWFRLFNTTFLSNSSDSDDVSYFSHTFLQRPEIGNSYSKVNNPNIDDIVFVIKQIFDFNNIDLNYFIRINANLVTSSNIKKRTNLHEDHSFPHKNFLLYLTNSGGKTIVNDEEFDPKEDDSIIFSGEHCHEIPKKNDRIVIVATFV